MTDKDKIDFGFTDINKNEKTAKVNAVFTKVADKYDLMNDAMSLGMHRLWKRHFIRSINILPGQNVCDLAAGSGDISLLIAKKLLGHGRIILSDINADMLETGYNKMLDAGFIGISEAVVADAQDLPFAANSFDRVTMAFGLRNVTDKKLAIAEMYRIVKPGGLVAIMEFSKPRSSVVASLYDKYSFDLIPYLGKKIANDSDSYRYLVESIRRHPDQNKLQQWILEQGFGSCEVTNILSGVVAIHKAWKY